MPNAIAIDETGGPEVLTFKEYDPGPPGPGQARVRVRAAGVNFIDTYQRSGAYPRALPFVPGLEGAGTIEQLGADVPAADSGWRAGDRVAWAQVSGSYAEYVLAPLESLVRVPDGVELEQAAAAMLQGMTAHYLSYSVRETTPGEIALVHAAAGGTGQLLVQLLKNAGARVFGTCSSAAKAEFARSAGADEVIRYDQLDFAAEARRLTHGRGVDAVYDSVGKTTFDGSLKALRPRGMLVLFGQASGPVPPLDLQRLNQHGSLYVTRPSLGHYVASRAEFEQRAGDVFDAIRRGQLRLRIDQSFALGEAAAAHRKLEARGSTGKLLLTP